jgi:hypothetical protein
VEKEVPMGHVMTMKPGPLDADWAGVEVVVPDLPWEVDYVPSGRTLAALERASNALGQLEGAVKAHGSSWSTGLAIGTCEGWATSRLCGKPGSWRAIGGAIANPDLLRRVPTTAVEKAATAIATFAGLGGAHAWQEVSQVVPQGVGFNGATPARYWASFVHAYEGWIIPPDNSDLVRAALVCLSIAATAPDSPEVGLVARATLSLTLLNSGRTSVIAPVSWGLLHTPETWPRLAQTLATSGPPDPETVDDAVAALALAVEIGARGALFEAVLHAQYLSNRIGNSDARAWLGTTSSSVKSVFAVVHNLPGVGPEQLTAYLGISRRTVDRAVLLLSQHGLATTDGEVGPLTHYVVRAKPKWTPWLECAPRYMRSATEERAE